MERVLGNISCALGSRSRPNNVFSCKWFDVITLNFAGA